MARKAGKTHLKHPTLPSARPLWRVVHGTTVHAALQPDALLCKVTSPSSRLLAASPSGVLGEVVHGRGVPRYLLIRACRQEIVRRLPH